jgi:hypothetical protein
MLLFQSLVLQLYFLDLYILSPRCPVLRGFLRSQLAATRERGDHAVVV